MANKRNLKRYISFVCDELLAECMAASLYGTKETRENAEAIIFSIAKIGREFRSRVSHPEPGMNPKVYFKNLTEKFNAGAVELMDQINNLY